MGFPVTSRTDKAPPPQGVAVHLGHDDAVEVDALGERLDHVDDVLAVTGVDHHEDLIRALTAALIASASAIMSSSTCKRPAVSMMTTSRSEIDRILHALLGDADRVLPSPR